MQQIDKALGISKARLAAELDAPRSRITQLCQQGLPMLQDGTLDRHQALRWIIENITGAGGWGAGRRGQSLPDRARTLLRTIGPKASPVGTLPSGSADRAVWLALQFCGSARTAWPPFVASLDLDMVPEGERLVFRALLVTLMIHLAESWMSKFIDGAELPPIAWECFGRDAEKLRAESEALRREWALQNLPAEV